MITLHWKPIDRWPREQTKNREHSQFRRTSTSNGYRRDEIPWTDTKLLLEGELRHIGVRDAVIQLALKDRDIRLDGQIRADARIAHPGVVLSLIHPKQGPLTFACDKWTTWQSNIRGIAKALEALRLVDRYGITSSGEQYTGWKELPSGMPLGERAEEVMSEMDAARILAGAISHAHDLEQNARTVLEDPDFRRYAYRQAVKLAHPDTGAEASDGFLRIQRAKDLLDP